MAKQSTKSNKVTTNSHNESGESMHQNPPFPKKCTTPREQLERSRNTLSYIGNKPNSTNDPVKQKRTDCEAVISRLNFEQDILLFNINYIESEISESKTKMELEELTKELEETKKLSNNIVKDILSNWLLMIDITEILTLTGKMDKGIDVPQKEQDALFGKLDWEEITEKEIKRKVKLLLQSDIEIDKMMEKVVSMVQEKRSFNIN